MVVPCQFGFVYRLEFLVNSILYFTKALPFGQSFLSAAVRIGSLVVCMAAFSCAWVWRSGGGGLHGVELSCGAVTGTLLRQSRELAKAMRFRRKLERITLDIFLSTRS